MLTPPIAELTAKFPNALVANSDALISFKGCEEGLVR